MEKEMAPWEQVEANATIYRQLKDQLMVEEMIVGAWPVGDNGAREGLSYQRNRVEALKNVIHYFEQKLTIVK